MRKKLRKCELFKHTFTTSSQRYCKNLTTELMDSNTTKAQRKPITYKNGLTPDKVSAAKELLSQVSIAECARNAGVPVSTVHNVLRDLSPRVDLLSKVLVEANRELKRKQRRASTLPV